MTDEYQKAEEEQALQDLYAEMGELLTELVKLCDLAQTKGSLVGSEVITVVETLLKGLLEVKKDG